MRLRQHLPALLVAIFATGCGTSPEVVADKLDPLTAVTVTTSTSPLILYQDNSAHAAHARDFVYVGPVQINRMGEYRYYLWLGIWSAIPDTLPSRQRDGFDSITIFADGEPFELTLGGWSAEAVGASESVYVKPVASAAEAYYEVTVDQIRVLAASNDIRLLTSGPANSAFELWNGQKSAFDDLQLFLERTAY